jgi:hypothetical protein
MVAKRRRADWPRGPFAWHTDEASYASIPFTWNLPEVHAILKELTIFPRPTFVGGPAVDLMPGFFADIPGVVEGHAFPGILQMVNPLATRTTTGCMRRCTFCGVGSGKIESGGFAELADWPDLPILCDNNLLAASIAHFDRVLDRLERWTGADFNQGIDARLLTAHHAQRFARLRKPSIPLALDSMAHADSWAAAFDLLRSAGVALDSIRSLVLVGLDSGPDEAWERCRWITGHGVKACPMWFHRLDAMEWNAVTAEQASLGWDDEKRKDIMAYFYYHRDRRVRRGRCRLTVEAEL